LSVREKENLSMKEVYQRFCVGKASVMRWSKSLIPNVPQRSPTKLDWEAIKRDVVENPDSYIRERAAKFGVSFSGVQYALARLGLTRKKLFSHPKADPEIRKSYQQKIGSYQQEAKPVVYVDESGFAHNMPRLYGYARKGHRCFGFLGWGARGRTNVIGALLGTTLLTLSAWNINTEVFTSWVKQDLLPKLPPKCVIVMDNATFHQGAAMRRELQEAEHQLEYLPPLPSRSQPHRA